MNVDNFESQSALDFFNALDDFDSSTPDYMSEYNGALDEYDGASADDYAYDGIEDDGKFNSLGRSIPQMGNSAVFSKFLKT